MVIRRVSPLSCAKIGGALYALMGLIFGLVFAAAGTFIGAIAPSMPNMGPAFGSNLGMAFGAGMIVVMPIFYGVLGFLSTLIGAALYNLLAGMVGGVEIEVEMGPSFAGPVVRTTQV